MYSMTLCAVSMKKQQAMQSHWSVMEYAKQHYSINTVNLNYCSTDNDFYSDLSLYILVESPQQTLRIGHTVVILMDSHQVS